MTTGARAPTTCIIHTLVLADPRTGYGGRIGEPPVRRTTTALPTVAWEHRAVPQHAPVTLDSGSRTR